MIYREMTHNADNKNESRKCRYVVAAHSVQTPGKPLLVSMNVEIL
jgi:hypothetical protein